MFPLWWLTTEPYRNTLSYQGLKCTAHTKNNKKGKQNKTGLSVTMFWGYYYCCYHFYLCQVSFSWWFLLKIKCCIGGKCGHTFNLQLFQSIHILKIKNWIYFLLQKRITEMILKNRNWKEANSINSLNPKTNIKKNSFVLGKRCKNTVLTSYKKNQNLRLDNRCSI